MYGAPQEEQSCLLEWPWSFPELPDCRHPGEGCVCLCWLNNPQAVPQRPRNTGFIHSLSGVSGTEDEDILVVDSRRDQQSGQGVAAKSRAEWGQCPQGLILSHLCLDLLWEIFSEIFSGLLNDHYDFLNG